MLVDREQQELLVVGDLEKVSTNLAYTILVYYGKFLVLFQNLGMFYLFTLRVQLSSC